MRGALPLLMLLAAGACRQHELEDGRYGFGLTETLRDDCGLSSVPGVISAGTLRTTGDLVRFDYELFDIQLWGTYAHAVERMSLDGSATNVAYAVNGTPCLLDLLSVHLEGNTVDEGRFEGTMSFSLETERPEACVCELWLRYAATREAP